MRRPKRADDAGGIYHALNWGNARTWIFRKPEDFDAFERILAEGLKRYDVFTIRRDVADVVAMTNSKRSTSGRKGLELVNRITIHIGNRPQQTDVRSSRLSQ